MNNKLHKTIEPVYVWYDSGLYSFMELLIKTALVEIASEYITTANAVYDNYRLTKDGMPDYRDCLSSLLCVACVKDISDTAVCVDITYFPEKKHLSKIVQAEQLCFTVYAKDSCVIVILKDIEDWTFKQIFEATQIVRKEYNNSKNRDLFIKLSNKIQPDTDIELFLATDSSIVTRIELY